jgi:hypothetical protein
MLYVGLDIHHKHIATQAASRGLTWRIATSRYGMGATAYPLMALRPGG